MINVAIGLLVWPLLVTNVAALSTISTVRSKETKKLHRPWTGHQPQQVHGDDPPASQEQLFSHGPAKSARKAMRRNKLASRLAPSTVLPSFMQRSSMRQKASHVRTTEEYQDVKRQDHLPGYGPGIAISKLLKSAMPKD